MYPNSYGKSGTENMQSISLPSVTAILLSILVAVQAQCPWQREIPDLQTSCICAYNLGRELSVQCDQVSVLPQIIFLQINNQLLLFLGELFNVN